MRKGTAFCLVAFEDEGKLDLQVILPDNPDPLRLKWGGTSRQTVMKASEDYWLLVDRLMKSKVMTNAHDSERKKALLQLKAQGAQVLHLVLSPEMQEVVAQVAKEAEILAIITDLLVVPWESLFFGDADEGQFLGLMTTVCRATHRQRDANAGKFCQTPAVAYSKNDHLIILDPVLADTPLEVDGSATLRSFIEDDIKGTSTRVVLSNGSMDEWIAHARSVPFVHWVVEHELDGLRVGDGAHFVPAFCSIMRFGSGVLVLSGCETGAGRDQRSNFACLITYNNHIAVAAPTAKVGFTTAALFYICPSQVLARFGCGNVGSGGVAQTREGGPR